MCRHSSSTMYVTWQPAHLMHILTSVGGISSIVGITSQHKIKRGSVKTKVTLYMYIDTVLIIYLTQLTISDNDWFLKRANEITGFSSGL